MYNILIWKDHAINPNNTYAVKENPDGTITLTPAGEVLQQGTNMSATNFNNMEFGIADADLASRILLMAVRDATDRLTVTEADISKAVTEYHAEHSPEEKSVTLNNTVAYPFNNSETTVAISTRKTGNYTVETEVTDSNGNVGEIVVSAKQYNGFKIAFTGSAKSVTLKIKIRGGIIV